MKKQKQVEQEIRWLRKYVKWALNTFDKESYRSQVRPLHFSRRGYPPRWIIDPAPSRDLYLHIRNVIIPELLNIYEEQHLITPEKHQILLSQINSPDREDWYLAFVVIDQINPHKN